MWLSENENILKHLDFIYETLEMLWINVWRRFSFSVWDFLLYVL